MKINVDVIDLEIPPRVKRWGLRIGIPAVVLGTGAVALAGTPLHSWATNDTLQAVDLNGNFSNLQEQITALVPPGTIQAYGGIIDGNPGDTVDGGAPAHLPPSGWLLCNGDQLNGLNSTYASLYAAIGINFGGNTTSQAFNLPDLRGRFLRATDNGAGIDPDSASRTYDNIGGNTGDQVGSSQTAAFAAHTHSYLTSTCAEMAQAGTGGVYYTMNSACYGTNTSGAAGGSETRPVNVYVNYIIKY